MVVDDVYECREVDVITSGRVALLQPVGQQRDRI